MSENYVETRLNFLKATQNPDGGWGYFPGKRSWLEPTAYALLALHKETGTETVERGWKLLRGWQRSDGAWKPSEQVEDAHWGTALMITLHCARQVYDSAFRKGVDWLLEGGGAEGTMLMRIANLFQPSPTGHDPKFRGWPWKPDTTSWIEPTAHSLIALKQAASQVPRALLKRRVVLAEGMILHRRCSDGGWNYGSRRVLGVDLPSYPETTALALLGLQGNRTAEIESAVARAKSMWAETKSPLAKAWLAITLRNYGVALPAPEDSAPMGRDIQLAALECIGYPGGAHTLLKPAGIA
jgi:hypothetical protein